MNFCYEVVRMERKTKTQGLLPSLNESDYSKSNSGQTLKTGEYHSSKSYVSQNSDSSQQSNYFSMGTSNLPSIDSFHELPRKSHNSLNREENEIISVDNSIDNEYNELENIMENETEGKMYLFNKLLESGSIKMKFLNVQDDLSGTGDLTENDSNLSNEISFKKYSPRVNVNRVIEPENPCEINVDNNQLKSANKLEIIDNLDGQCGSSKIKLQNKQDDLSGGDDWTKSDSNLSNELSAKKDSLRVIVNDVIQSVNPCEINVDNNQSTPGYKSKIAGNADEQSSLKKNYRSLELSNKHFKNQTDAKKLGGQKFPLPWSYNSGKYPKCPEVLNKPPRVQQIRSAYTKKNCSVPEVKDLNKINSQFYITQRKRSEDIQKMNSKLVNKLLNVQTNIPRIQKE